LLTKFPSIQIFLIGFREEVAKRKTRTRLIT